MIQPLKILDDHGVGLCCIYYIQHKPTPWSSSIFKGWITLKICRIINNTSSDSIHTVTKRCLDWAIVQLKVNNMTGSQGGMPGIQIDDTHIYIHVCVCVYINIYI